MSTYNVRLASVRVKDKANIYNDLRTFTGSNAPQGLGCIEGGQDGQKRLVKASMHYERAALIPFWAKAADLEDRHSSACISVGY
jgi:hypothetical protein